MSNETKRDIDRDESDKLSTLYKYFAGPLRFRWNRRMFDELVMGVIGRAYERGVLNGRQMHEIVRMWKRISFPELPPREDYSANLFPSEFRWYRRGEQDPTTPCVFATFGEGEDAKGKPVKYFTNVYGEDRAAIDAFVASKIWTHWHPLSAKPDIAAETLADTVSHIVSKTIEKEKRFGGSLRQ